MYSKDIEIEIKLNCRYYSIKTSKGNKLAITSNLKRKANCAT